MRALFQLLIKNKKHTLLINPKKIKIKKDNIS
jgi:hypothetical protein